jgi:ABC-type sugar transport system ATPase subunit
MDEPTRGIDVGTKYEIYKLMNKMTDNGMCIIMVNSDIEELMGMSDRIIVIREGEITGELEKKDATAEKIMHFAMGGGG